MKRLVLGLGLLGIALGGANGCDDTRPVAGLPPDGQAGEMSQGGEPAAGSAGSLDHGGDGGTTPSAGGAETGGTSLGGQSGQSQGGQAPEAGGAGGAAP